jgi:PIN domain nuclease of toxin-antitoxin system
MPGLLLDTCAVYWWHVGAPQLSNKARLAISRPGVSLFVSASTAWEMVTKWRSGRQPEFGALASNFAAILAVQGFRELPISVDHAVQAANLPLHHKDPFDRIIIAQALLEGLAIVTGDPVFDQYGVTRTW